MLQDRTKFSHLRLFRFEKSDFPLRRARFERVKKSYTKHQKEEIHTKKAHNKNVFREIFFAFTMKQ